MNLLLGSKGTPDDVGKGHLEDKTKLVMSFKKTPKADTLRHTCLPLTGGPWPPSVTFLHMLWEVSQTLRDS